jgi:hypothetical protein
MICRFITLVLVSNFQRCIDELNLDLQRVHEWATANGLDLNPMKSQVIVINRCRVDIPPSTLLIGSDVVSRDNKMAEKFRMVAKHESTRTQSI